MKYIILTWNSQQDIEIVREKSGEPMVFKTLEQADNWQWDNDSRMGNYHKIVEL